MNKSKFSLLLVFILIFSNNAFSQTSSFGSYEVYTHESKMNSLGYLTISFQLPSYLNSQKLNFKGAQYNHNYLMGEIGSYVFAENNRVRFITEGSFRVGAAFGDNFKFASSTTVSPKSKYYLFALDVFSFDIGTEYTFVINNGYAFTAKLMFTLVNAGGMFAMREKGILKEDAFGSTNLIPLIIKPSLFVDFGRSGLGISFYINPINFLSYRYSPKDLFDSKDMGILAADKRLKQFAFQISFVW